MKQEVPLLDLTAQYESLKLKIESVIKEVCDSQRFILGPEVEALEREVASYCDTEYGIGVSSGTDALVVALMALDVGPGDEVITTPYTFFATAGSIARLGAKPVFVDIRLDTFNIDASKIEAAITERTKAIMIVHLFGQTADVDAVSRISEKTGIPVIEDAAQAIGATFNGKKAGSFGFCGCLSFFPSKNLGAFGDGGMVVTNDESFATKVKQLRMHGETSRYHHKFVGGNFRLDALQAAILRVKLPHLDSWADGRIANAKRYSELFAELALGEHVTLPSIAENCGHVFNQFIIRAERRDELKEYLAAEGIGVNIYYPLSLHQQECFAYLGNKTGDFPMSEEAAASSLALPIFPELSDRQLVQVAETISSFYSS